MAESVIVTTKSGQLRGTTLTSFEGYDYSSFKGIPYAKPPVGQLRFRDPLPADPWKGIREAIDFGSSCAQYDFTARAVQGSDDCLYLNVYVKSIKPNNPLPVMVWIHGGAFMFGSGDDLLYGPDYFLKKDIVLVTINYRVGVLGFLNFDDEAAPGNQGLKDQLMALRWVQENIQNFGGDRNNVTIFGESAGGASVNYLTLSPLSKGLFHKAISQSGVACNTWACSAKTETAYKLCKALGNNSRDPKKLVEFLRTVDCEKLIETVDSLRDFKNRLECTYPFGPGVDRKSKEPLMPIHPSEAIKIGVHIPYIFGCNSHEGIFSLPGLKEKELFELDNNFEKYLNPVTVDLLKRNRITAKDLVGLYFGNEKICEENIQKFIDLWSDLHFIEGIHRVISAQVNQSSAPIYFYRFLYDKGITSITKMLAETSMPGTSHFDEVQYQFSMKLYDLIGVDRLQRGTPHYRIMEQMIELWVNFATYGRPTPQVTELIPTYWLPVTNDKVFRALNINEELRMGSVLNIDEHLCFGKFTKPKL